ncbi:hypothetical protein [Mesobacillus maritimus]|uniref:hypothetical protein n=1 Tax=Mesobacillus maritimus TaxID=1643336 RepID=UPI00384D7E7F
MDYKGNFISTMKEDKENHKRPLHHKKKKTIPPRVESILEPKPQEIPPRTPGILDDFLYTRSRESVDKDIRESWENLQAKYGDPSVSTDMILEDLFKWMNVSKANRRFVYNKLLELTNSAKESRGKIETIEYLSNQIERIKEM